MAHLVRHLVHTGAPAPRPWLRASTVAFVLLVACAQLDLGSVGAALQVSR